MKMNNLYGFCPICGGEGVQRERRLNGNDKCENGHTYPSRSALTSPEEDDEDAFAAESNDEVKRILKIE